jgi:hypothetical protein
MRAVQSATNRSQHNNNTGALDIDSRLGETSSETLLSRRRPYPVTAAAPFLSLQHETAFVPISLMIKFIVMVNKQGQTRLARYYGVPPTESRCSAAAARHTQPSKCSMTRLQVQE